MQHDLDIIKFIACVLGLLPEFEATSRKRKTKISQNKRNMVSLRSNFRQLTSSWQ